jgi:hypothetical protein
MCPDDPQPGGSSVELWELWEIVDDDGTQLAFFPSSQQHSRDRLEAHAKLIFTVEASGYDDAMQKRNDFLGWGPYTPIPNRND